MKKLICCLVIATMLITLFAGCGSKTTNETSKTTNEASKVADEQEKNEIVKIDLWHSMGGDKGKAIKKTVQDFNNTAGKDLGIEVTSVYQGGDVVEKLKTVVQANDVDNIPDIGQIYGLGISTVLKMDQTVWIEDMISQSNSKIKKEDLEPSAVRAFSYQDKMVGMPFNISTILLYYNKDMFAKAGLDPENPPKTIDELAKAVEKLTVKKGNNVERYGLNVAVRRYQLCNFIGGQGEYNFFGDNEGGRSNPMTKVTFGEDGTLKKFLTEWKKVINTSGYKYIEDNINEEFATELHAMTIMSTSRINLMNNLTKDRFEYGVAYLPKVDANDKGGASVGGGSLCMFDRGDQAKKDAAWEFIQYAASPEAQFEWHKNTGYIPVNTKVYDIPEVQTYLNDNPAFKVAIEQLHESNPNVQEPFDLVPWELDSIIRDTMVEFAEGDLTVDETVEKIVSGCNERLDTYHRAND